MRLLNPVLLTLFLLYGCKNTNENNDTKKEITRQKQAAETSISLVKKDTCELEKQLIKNGLVDITAVIPDIKIDLRYSTPNNFMRKDLYGDLERIYIVPAIAQKLKKAQAYLKNTDSSLSLLVFDCVRPLSVQQKMWDAVKMPTYKKIKFLSNPAFGSIHNYGAAVDLSICDGTGKELDMGTPYDDTAKLAYPELENYFLTKGELKKDQLKNRQLLRSVMYRAGFFGIQSEWWHFNGCNREYAKATYKMIN